MEVRVLCIKIGRGRIISKPWDFEAMCLIDDNKDKNTIVEMCLDSLCYLFEGTNATDDMLNKLSFETLSNMCEKMYLWYIKDIQTIAKTQTSENDNNSKLRDIYTAFFKTWGTLPSEIGKQKPTNIFLLIKGEKTNISNLPPEIQALYGI